MRQMRGRYHRNWSSSSWPSSMLACGKEEGMQSRDRSSAMMSSQGEEGMSCMWDRPAVTKRPPTRGLNAGR